MASYCQTVRAQSDPFTAQIRPTDPLAPAAEQATFRLPPGFRIELVACEPVIHKPLNMAFDDRGRLWVTDTVEYPFPAPPDRAGRDRVVILEDTDGDGRADRHTIFADGLNIPIGLYPTGDGVIVFSIPYIWHLRDTDGDGHADRRIKLYGPFDYSRDTHGLNNAFRRSFDGWVYACHGFSNHSKVRGRDGHVAEMVSGNTYRFRLDGGRIEVYTHGQVNPFGMTIDDAGDLFTADCHSKPLTHLIRGGHYPSFGRPHDGLGFVPPMMSHLHGSTAIAGIAWCGGASFPDSLRNTLFTGNVMTSRINHDRMRWTGGTVVAEPMPDFLTTTDPWFRPVDLQFGPDGALYVADFYNRIIGHYEVPLDHPGRDRERGRIWRISYHSPKMSGGRFQPLADLSHASPADLIAELDHPSVDRRLRALHQLVDHYGAAAGEPIRRAWPQASARTRVGLLWAAARTGRLQHDDQILGEAIESPATVVRIHAQRVIGALDWTSIDGTRRRRWHDWLLRGLHDNNGRVRSAAAEAVGRHPQSGSAVALLRAWRDTPSSDVVLQHVIKIALRNVLRDADASAWRALSAAPLDANARDRLVGVMLGVRNERAARFLIDFLANNDLGTRDRLLELTGNIARYAAVKDLDRFYRLAKKRSAGSLERQALVWRSIVENLEARSIHPLPTTLRTWAASLVPSLTQEAQQSDKSARLLVFAAEVARDSGQTDGTASLVRALDVVTLEPSQRRRVLLAVAALRPHPYVRSLLPVVDSPLATTAQRQAVERIVRRSLDHGASKEAETEAARRTFQRILQEVPYALQRAIIVEALGQPAVRKDLIARWRQGRLSPALFHDPQVASRLELVIGADRLASLRAVLPQAPDARPLDEAFLRQAVQVVARHQATPRKGRALFDRHCAACHQLAGKGALIGPQLDGIGQRGIPRLIEDVLDPNRNVDPKFRTTILQLEDGRVVAGLERRRDGTQLVLADANGKEFRVEASRIEARRRTSLSLMPDNFRETIPASDLVELLAFLARQHDPGGTAP